MKLLWLVCFTVTAVGAQNVSPNYVLSETANAVSPQDRAAILAAVCDGKVEGNVCDTCPESPAGAGGDFSLKRIVLGHFLEPNSTDALVSVSGCEQMHASIGWGFLISRRGTGWETVDEALGLELDHCRKMRFQSGRHLLICEDYRMESFHLMHSVTAIFAKGSSIGFRNLLTATDTTRDCEEQAQLRKAQIDRIEFRDLNGDGIEDIAFTVTFGTLTDSTWRRRLCEENGGARRPEPSVMKPYRIEYLFNGRQFTLTKASEPAAKLFQREE